MSLYFSIGILREYICWRENTKEVLGQGKINLDTLEEEEFVELTTNPSSVKL